MSSNPLEMLVQIGFTRKDAEKALQQANNDFDTAMNILTDGTKKNQEEYFVPTTA